MNELFGRQAALEEAHRAFDKICGASDSLDNKLQNLLAFLSLIISIAATVQVSMLQSVVGVWFWLLIIAAMILYLFAFYQIMGSLHPREFVIPYFTKWETIVEVFFHKPEVDIINQLLSSYLEADKIARRINESKARAIRNGSCFLVVIVVLLIIAVPIGILFPSPNLADISKYLKFS